MTNPNLQDFKNHLAAEIPPAQKIYAFKDLPPIVQENLLRLQNTDGDFLKTSEKSAVLAQVVFLFLVLNIFGGFVSAFDFSKIDAIKAIFFSIGCILFMLWTAYYGRNIYRMFALPIKNHSYLTPTQLIETKSGTVKYRELKDVVEIVLDKAANRSSSGGSDYTLNLKFADGDCYEYLFERWVTEHLSEAEQWREKAIAWRDKAVNAFERGDVAYFDSRDIFQSSAMANIPVWKESFRFLTPRFLFKITLLLLAVFLVLKLLTKFL